MRSNQNSPRYSYLVKTGKLEDSVLCNVENFSNSSENVNVHVCKPARSGSSQVDNFATVNMLVGNIPENSPFMVYSSHTVSTISISDDISLMPDLEILNTDGTTQKIKLLDSGSDSIDINNTPITEMFIDKCKCLYTNADQLRNELDELKVHVFLEEPDFIFVTEVLPKFDSDISVHQCYII